MAMSEHQSVEVDGVSVFEDDTEATQEIALDLEGIRPARRRLSDRQIALGVMANVMQISDDACEEYFYGPHPSDDGVTVGSPTRERKLTMFRPKFGVEFIHQFLSFLGRHFPLR